MSVAGISSTSALSQSNLFATFQQRRTDFQQLSQALQNGDLTDAQAAYTDLTNLSKNSSSTAANSNSQISQDFAAIGTALQNGDLAGAQQAFATFQQDVKAAFQQRFQNLQSQSQQAQQSQQTQQPSVHHHHHHHHSANNDSQNSGSNGDSISITDANGDKVTINLGSGNSNGGPENVTLNFGANNGPEQVTLNLNGNDNITLSFGSVSSSNSPATSTSQTTGSQLNVTA